MDIAPTISGIDAASLLQASAGAQLIAGADSPDGQDGPDFAQSAVSLTLAGVSIDVQARVLQAQQDTVKSMLDMVA